MASLIYVSNARLPSEKANSFQAMQQCEALGDLADVEFWHPRRRANPLEGRDVYAYYGIRPTFRLRPIACVDSGALRARVPRAGFLMQVASFQAVCAARLACRRGRLMVYSRNPLDIFLMPAIRAVHPRAGLFLEDHDGLLRRGETVKRQLLRAVDGIVVTSAHHAAELAEAGVASAAVLVAPNAVNVERFAACAPAAEGTRPVRVVYVGNLFRWKGVFTLVDAFSHLPDAFTLTVIGGSPELSAPFDAHVAARGLERRVTRIGPVPPAEVPALVSGASVVVLPNSAASDLSSRLTSPLKLFEYMASHIPIVASDIPAVQAVLEHGRNAWLVPPDDPVRLAEGIARVVDDPPLGRRLAAAARLDAQSRSWVGRADQILDFIAARTGVVVRKDAA